MKTVANNISLSDRRTNVIMKFFLSIAIFIFNVTLLNENLKIGKYGGVYSYGILGVLDIFVFSALAIFGLQHKNTIRHSYVAILYLGLLIFVPQMFVKLPIFPFVYRVYGHVDYIIQTGHAAPEIPTLSYQTWPGIMFLGAISEMITRLGVYILLMTPVLYYLTVLPLIYSLMKDLTNSRTNSILGVMFFMASFYGFNWFVPGGLASLILMASVYFLFRAHLGYNAQYLKVVSLLLLSTGVLVFTHFMTSILWAVTIVDSIVFSTFIIKDEKTKRMSMTLLLLFLIFQVYWTLGHTYSANLFKQRLNSLVEFMIATGAVEKWTEVAQMGITHHSKVLQIKMYFSYSIVGISLIAVLIVLRDFLEKFLKTRKSDRPVLLLALILASYILVIPALFGNYSGEIPSRILAGSRYILAIFVALALKNLKFKKILITTLPILLLLSILCTYGNMSYDYVAPNEIAGISYTSVYIPSKFYTIPDALWDFKYLANPYSILPIDSLKNPKGLENSVVTIVLSSRRIDGYVFFTGKDINIIDLKVKSSRIYFSSNHYPKVSSTFEIYGGP
ncbi:hypothetical protein A3L11_03665 [Thermococcus siculi]|uniref:Glycosyltransferase RgtA/B/C/D-like domain-containing protein n=1 Tax=Thermococcus siculi TaxID=72803 RepID=A0A2Z2MNY5_9EURY|nr:hypothetical protein [Thermococcus siculi]ASJ08377.1 hypothetical protein A3L11_03665 [Thermococcus siculi]